MSTNSAKRNKMQHSRLQFNLASAHSQYNDILVADGKGEDAQFRKSSSSFGLDYGLSEAFERRNDEC